MIPTKTQKYERESDNLSNADTNIYVSDPESGDDIYLHYSPIETEINNIFGNTYEEKIHYLATCNCCERHQFNKPIVYTSWVELPTAPRSLQARINMPCFCNCRHMARFICRTC